MIALCGLFARGRPEAQQNLADAVQVECVDSDISRRYSFP